jgi:hypothetical protein
MPTFDELERGGEGRPVDLYRFDFGVETFRFTNVDQEITFSGAPYIPLPIKRGNSTLNPKERNNTKMALEVPADTRPFSDFVGVQPASRLECSITRIQLDESVAGSPIPSPEPAPAPTTGFVIFEGFVTSIAFSGRTCSLDLNPFNQQFTREVPRFKYTGLCNHILYDSFCALDKNSFSQSGVVNGISGNVITISGFTGTAFTGGYIENAAANDFRMIIAHSSDAMTILLPFREDVLGTTVKCYQGCDHSVTVCRDKFANVPNFGGFPLVPGKNPFTQAQFTKK